MEVTGAGIDVGRAEPAPVDLDGTPSRSASSPSAHELVGASRTMLELAREHALERVQFGRPISSFQAVRHRLAETLVAIETADAVLAAAWDDRSRRPRRWPRRWPVGAPAPPPATASRCSPASASPPSTRCTSTSAGCSSSTSCSARPQVLTRALGQELLDDPQLPPLLPL